MSSAQPCLHPMLRPWGRLSAAAAVGAAAVVTTASPAFADAAAPARGAPLSDIVPASIVAVMALVLLVAVAWGHRRGAFKLLVHLGAFSERQTGVPGWAAVPNAVGGLALVVAAFGFYWDVSWHIDRGRDPGPFANPAHWFIIVGLAGIALAGLLAIIMGDDRRTRAAVRIRPGWYAPVGGVLVAVCGVLALAGFPLDDAWHRIFGQDVTLWGPTHVQMIGGASLATLALWVLLVEGLDARDPSLLPTGRRPRIPLERAELLLGGAFLLGLSTLQGEFDFGVPQFRQLYHPVLIMLAGSTALVAVRIRRGRGAALGAVVFFLLLRGALTLLIAPVLGRSVLHFPLYIAEAIVVELVVAWVGRQRQLTAGLLCGVGIGTIGLAAEWLWSHVWMPLPWHASLLPEAAVFGFAAAVAGGVLGGMAGRALAPADLPRQRTPRGAAAAAWLVALVCVAYPLPMSSGQATATVTLTGAGTLGPDKAVDVRVELDPAGAAEHANWFNVTAWQGRPGGDGGLVIAGLHRQPDGAYSTDEPVPVGGTWKTILRLHRGHELLSMPVFLPGDPAIPAPEVPAPPALTRPFVADKTVLQREAVGGSVGLQRAAYAGLALLGIAWIASLVWGLRRLERSQTEDDGTAGAVVGAATTRGEVTREAAGALATRRPPQAGRGGGTTDRPSPITSPPRSSAKGQQGGRGTVRHRDAGGR